MINSSIRHGGNIELFNSLLESSTGMFGVNRSNVEDHCNRPHVEGHYNSLAEVDLALYPNGVVFPYQGTHLQCQGSAGKYYYRENHKAGQTLAIELASQCL